MSYFGPARPFRPQIVGVFVEPTSSWWGNKHTQETRQKETPKPEGLRAEGSEEGRTTERRGERDP